MDKNIDLNSGLFDFLELFDDKKKSHDKSSCECEGHWLTAVDGVFFGKADICSHCKKGEESKVIVGIPVISFLFKSKDVSLNTSLKVESHGHGVKANTLTVGGTGTVVTADGDFPAAFTLVLKDQYAPVQAKSVYLNIQWVEHNGVRAALPITLSPIRSDSVLNVKECCHEHSHYYYTENPVNTVSAPEVSQIVYTRNGVERIIPL